MAQLVKNLPAMWETSVQSLGWKDSLEKGKTTHSREFHGLYSPWGHKEAGHNWATFAYWAPRCLRLLGKLLGYFASAVGLGGIYRSWKSLCGYFVAYLWALLDVSGMGFRDHPFQPGHPSLFYLTICLRAGRRHRFSSLVCDIHSVMFNSLWPHQEPTRLLCGGSLWSPPGSSVHGILHARILELASISF